MKVKERIIGYYNERGYRVASFKDRKERDIYTTGNHRQDSQRWVEPGSKAALPVATLRKFCDQTAKDIAKERKAVFGGIEYEETE